LVHQRHLNAGGSPVAHHRVQQLAQWIDQREQAGVQDFAHLHVDDAMALLFIEADQHRLALPLCAQRRAPAGQRSRKNSRSDRRRRDLLLRERPTDPLREKIGVARIVDMLQLASTASRKVAARRVDAMRSLDQSTIRPQEIAGRRQRGMSAVLGDTLSARRNADDGNGLDAHFGHRRSGLAARPGPADGCTVMRIPPTPVAAA